MPGFEVRPITDEERRPVWNVLLQSLHRKAPDDEKWDRAARSWPADRKFAAFEGGTPIGAASSFGTRMAVPGGDPVPAAAVNGIGVRADRTRRGVLTTMMTAQLPDLRARGDLIACLHASEATIYGRFGYGPAVLAKTVSLAIPAARIRPEIPAVGDIRFLDLDEAAKRIPELYRRLGLHRPGMIERPDVWWPHEFEDALRKGDRVVVHSGPDGDDGFAVYETKELRSPLDPGKGALLEVYDVHASDPAAYAALWRFLAGVDLVSCVLAEERPVDEPLEWLLTDHRKASVAVGDSLWVRLLDVEAALTARGYGDAEPVVLAVTDRQLPENSGHYEVGPGRVARTDRPAALELDVDVLAMLYLGGWRASVLAQTGRITVHDPAGLSAVDTLFATPGAPWCGTFF